MNRIRPNIQPEVTNDAMQTPTDQVPDVPPSTGDVNTEKGARAVPSEAQNDLPKVPEEAVPAEDAQYGIRKIEAVTLIWSKKSLTALLCK